MCVWTGILLVGKLFMAHGLGMRGVTHLEHVDRHEAAEKSPADPQDQQEEQVDPEDVMQALGDIAKEVLGERVVVASPEDVRGEEVVASYRELGVRGTGIPVT